MAALVWCRALISIGLFVSAVLLVAADGFAQLSIDLSKLSPGDRVEVKRRGDWELAEVVEVSSDNVIQVRIGDTKIPVPISIQSVRLPPKVRTADDPFATEEERNAAGRLRTWSDRSGKFKVQGTLLKHNDREIVLRRPDKKEVTVPVDRLSDDDKKFLADVKSGNVTLESATKPKAKRSAGDQALNLTPTNLNEARVVDLSPTQTWKYAPDPAPNTEALRPARVVLPRASEFSDKPIRVLLWPQAKKAYVVYMGNWHDGVCRVHACNLNSKQVEAGGVFGSGGAPVDLAPDGSLVLARSERFGFGGQAELQLFEREGHAVRPLLAWAPYSHHEFMRSTADRPSLGPEADIEWTAFADPKHVITINGSGEMALWEVPNLRPLYVATLLKDTKPAMSPGRKYCAVACEDGIAILQVADGELAGFLPADMKDFPSHLLAFRADGQRLALCQGDRIRVWDLTKPELVADFAVQWDGRPPGTDDSAAGPNGPRQIRGKYFASKVAWVGDEHLLVNGSLVLDVERALVLWTYRRISDAWQVHDGRLWFVTSGLGGRDYVLGSAKVPHQAARDLIKGKAAEDFLAVRPGQQIAIELNGVPSEHEQFVKNALAARLKENKLEVVEQSELRLVGSIARGETVTRQFRNQRTGETVSQTLTGQILTLQFKLGDKTVWEFISRTAAPHFVRPKEGETLDQSLQRHLLQDPKQFAKIWIPSHVAALSDTSLPNASDVPPTD